MCIFTLFHCGDGEIARKNKTNSVKLDVFIKNNSLKCLNFSNVSFEFDAKFGDEKKKS